MRPAPAWGFQGPRSFALPEFDPYWSRVEESGILVVIHASDSGYERYFNEWEGKQGEAQAFAQPQPFWPRAAQLPRHPGRGHLPHRPRDAGRASRS